MSPWIITIISLVFSAFFSAYEISFFSSNKLRIELDRKAGKRYALIMNKFLQKPEELVSCLLMGNNVALVIYGIAIAKILNPLIEQYITTNLGGVLAIETVVATMIVLVTAEFLPKMLGKVSPNSVFSSLYWLTIFFYYLFYPLTYITNKLSFMIIRLFGFKKRENNRMYIFGKSDLMDLSEELTGDEKEDDEHKNDIEIFQNALNFSEVKVKECMVPRTEITAIDTEEPVNNLLELFIESGYSRIPVYKENIDNIIGYVHSKDLIYKKAETIGQYIRPVVFRDEQTRAQTLLAYLIKNRQPLAVIKDEWGGTSGIVTMEDLIEEIFGDISDELDKDELTEKKISDSEYVFASRLEVKEINKKYDIGLPDNDEYETLGGLITYYNENIPKEKEEVRVENFLFTVLKTSKNRLETVSLKILSE